MNASISTRLSIALFSLVILASSGFAQSMFDKVNDFDGDGRADYAVTRSENGLKVWYLWRSTAGYSVIQWGVAEDFARAGDYDGDSRTDIAVVRLSNGAGNTWIATTYYLASTTGSLGIMQVEQLNIVGALGLSNEDYDGDGKTDAAIFQWHGIGALSYKSSSTGTTSSVSMSWFQVRVGDLTGDRRAEVVSHNPGAREITINGSQTVRFGVAGDLFLAADFDGDDKGDITVFRPSTGDWWWMRSSDNVVNAIHWGVNGDVPVPADYDADGQTDFAVYRPASPQSIYYILGSTTGFSAFGFGGSTDTVVTY